MSFSVQIAGTSYLANTKMLIAFPQFGVSMEVPLTPLRIVILMRLHDPCSPQEGDQKSVEHPAISVHLCSSRNTRAYDSSVVHLYMHHDQS